MGRALAPVPAHGLALARAGCHGLAHGLACDVAPTLRLGQV